MTTPVQVPLPFAREDIDQNHARPSIDTYFPTSAADTLAKSEAFNKHLYRPNTYLHKWWARRSGTTFRHILKQLVADPLLRDYYSPGGLTGLTIFDPMMGGGTTLHEAIRLGANVAGVDIDPIPVLQVAAALTPFREERILSLFAELMEHLTAAISHLFQTVCPTCGATAELQFMLYAVRKRCHCGEVLILDSDVISEGPRQTLRVCLRCGEITANEEHTCTLAEPQALITKDQRSCRQCQEPFQEILEAPYRERYVPVIVRGRCARHGEFFAPVSQFDRERLRLADALLDDVQLPAPPELRVPHGSKSKDLIRRNVLTYDELFTARQLLYIGHAARFLRTVSLPDKLPLALLISTSLDFNCLLCGYKGAYRSRPGAIRHVFSHHAYSFPYTALENNPIFSGRTSGTLRRLFHDRIVRGLRWSKRPVERLHTGGKAHTVEVAGEIDRGSPVARWADLATGTRRFLVIQADASQLEAPEGFADHVVTDPPYYDSVQYSNLSHFFRVWLRYLLPQEADWRYAEKASVVPGHLGAPGDYADTLAGIWATCRRALKPGDGRLIFTFHHWAPEAWAELAISLMRSEFRLLNYYVVYSENPKSVHIRRLRALKHDCVLVCATDGFTSNDLLWHKPAPTETSDSREFCGHCGRVLGWLLQARPTEDDVYTICRQLIGGTGSGKAPR